MQSGPITTKVVSSNPTL